MLNTKSALDYFLSSAGVGGQGGQRPPFSTHLALLHLGTVAQSQKIQVGYYSSCLPEVSLVHHWKRKGK